MSEYKTISPDVAETLEVIERSKFLSYAKGVENLDEALAFVASLKKKYYDATHVCFATVTKDAKKYSDDGEPQGTAGMPILDVITKKGLVNVVVAVVRYFGGIKLGAGGLVRAYSGGAAAVLDSAQKIVWKTCPQYVIECDYSLYKTVQRICADYGKVENTEFAECVRVTLTVTTGKTDLEAVTTETTNGKVTARFARDVQVAVNVD